jgi:hypothetical protein
MSDVTVSVVENTTSVVVSNDVVEINVTESPVTISTGTSGLQGATGPQGVSYVAGDPIFVTVRNATGATLPKGTIVYISGSNGNHVQVTPAIATSDATSARTLGWLAASIANNASGLCQLEGYLEGLNTQGLTSGSQLYLSGTTAGAFQVTKPQAPIHLVYVGVVTKVSAGDGHVYVKVQNGYELDEIHDVQITSVADGDLLEYDSATDLWKNVPQSALTVAQSQVTGLVSALAGKANLAGGNAFTGAQTITGTSAGSVVAVIKGASGQTANALQLQNNAGQVKGWFADNGDAQLGAIGLGQVAPFTPFGGAILGVNTDGAGNKGIVVRGTSGQSANLMEFQNNSSVTNLSVASTGTLIFGTDQTTNGSFLSAINGRIRVGLTDAGVVGVTIRGASGQTADLLQFQTNGGVVRAKVDQNGFAVFGNSTVLSNAVLSVNPFGATQVGQVIRGAASQTANLQEWQNSAGGIVARVEPAGILVTADSLRSTYFTNVANTGTYLDYQTNTPSFIQRSAASVALSIRGAASQTANLQEWQDSTPATLASINNVGTFNSNSSFGFQIAAATYYGSLNGGQTARIQAGASVGANPHVVVRGISGATGNLQEWQESNAGVPTYVNSIGSLRVRTYSNSFPFSALAVGAAAATEIGVIVRGAASQSANLQEWQNSAGIGVTSIGPDGAFYTNASKFYGPGDYSARFNFGSSGAGNIVAVIRGAASQSANLQEWQNSAGTSLISISSGGFISSNSGANFNSALVQIGAANGGGQITWSKQTAAATNPGANGARLYFRDGTTAGTLKLVVRAGAAGAETTILDNIPQ